ncbi:hypothetical protein H4S06_001171 [Coemansia sp. BCRC 34490]|nr:hypothetical protein H4S06_001171 [Coemansia sp. BCRC 34490]
MIMTQKNGYKDFYTSLWDVVKWPVDKAKLNAKQIADTISQFSTVISNAPNQGNSTLEITKQQWVESLAVAASFADPKFCWTTPEMRDRANEWIAEIAAHLDGHVDTGVDTDTASLYIDASVFRDITTVFVRPYFVPSDHSNTIGRQRVHRQDQQRDYTLMEEGGTEGARGSGSPYEDSSQSDDARWRKNPQCIATFSWALDHLCDEAITDAISSILPVVLALVEDHECQAKLWGLRLATQLLGRSKWIEFMRKSGIASVVDKSVGACLLYRSDGEGIAADLLGSAFEAAIASAHILYNDPNKPTYSQGWWRLVDKVVSNEMYVSDNIAASTVLCKQIGILCGPLGYAIARYLRPLVGILSQGLHSPVHLSQDICNLHLTIVQQLAILVDTCLPRMHVYGSEIMAALAYSWASSSMQDRVKTKDNIVGLDELQRCIIDVVCRLGRSCPEITQTCIDRLCVSRPKVFQQWALENKRLENKPN